MGYINSDGYDLIHRQEDVLRETPPPPVVPRFDPNKEKVGDKNHAGAKKQIEDNQARDAACGIPVEKAVPLPKRPKAFKCWLEKTLEKPFEFKIKLEIDMKDRVDPSAISNPSGDGA